MQHLLDFIQEHTLEDQLYLIASCPAGELEVLWRRAEAPDHWQLRPKGCEGPWELIQRRVLIHDLELRGADMATIQRELHAMLAALIAFADMVLRDANQQLGSDLVRRYVLGHQAFIQQLEAAVKALSLHAEPNMELVAGGGARTTLRTGHLSLVR